MKVDKYNWDLECLLEGKTIEQLYKQWLDLSNQQVSLLNDFYKSKQNFINWLLLDLKVSKVTNRLVNYLSNHFNYELDSQVWNGWIQKLSYDANVLAQKLANYSNIVIANEQTIRSYLKDSKLSAWTREFEFIFKNKKHILDDKSEQILAKLSVDGGAVGEVFTTLTDSDLKYEDAIDKKGKHHPIKTHADVVKYLKNTGDRALRKSAWISYNQAYRNVANTLSKTLYYNYLRVNTWSKLRNYQDYIDAALDNDEVDRPLLLAVYDNVASYKDVSYVYKNQVKKILKKMFKLDKLYPWDASLDLMTKPVKFTKEEAINEVKSALKPLGKEYLDVVNKAFNDNWISWMPKEHKLSGAYSIGNTYGLSKYYILTNFNSTSDAVSTIAHEMGHSVNSYFINTAQTIYADVDMFTAEIASIVNEMLLNFYWLNKFKKNKNMLIHIYDNMISTFFACTTRQIIFSKFEYEVNDLINKGQPFTKEIADKLYFEVTKQYEKLTKKQIANWNKKPYDLANSLILRIPHFYANNFYVWKYAISQIVAIVVANEIYSGNKEMVKNYIKFLKAGTSIPPLDIIKILGIDLHKPEVYAKAKEIVTKLVKEFVKIK